MYELEIDKRTFNFKFEARTSRGLMTNRICWFLKLKGKQFPGLCGTGEVAPLPGLSVETESRVGQELAEIKNRLAGFSMINTTDPSEIENQLELNKYSSSVRFGLTMAFLDLFQGGAKKIFDGPFYQGQPLSINGLVWMDSSNEMLKSAIKKIADGFSCIKFKVGGIDFKKECEILEKIRSIYPAEKLAIRLDANGAFTLNDVEQKLNELSRFQIHSIEQPLKPDKMLEQPELIHQSPIPIGLDEQLLGSFSKTQKQTLLNQLRPSFLILKPGLIGGFTETKNWIEIALQNGIGWWITSALESPIGLNAIAQFTSLFLPAIPQGLGTGQVFDQKFEHPLEVSNGQLWLNRTKNWGF